MWLIPRVTTISLCIWPGGTAVSPGKPRSPGYPPAGDLLNLTYAQRAAAAVCAYISLYTYMHENASVKASGVDLDERTRRGGEAARRAVELQRAIVALVGTHRRRAYAHDLVYGMHQLYTLFAKPWNASTEGNEHAHQDMKNFFRHMVCHRGHDALDVLKLLIVKSYVFESVAEERLAHSEYCAMRVNSLLKRSGDAEAAGSKLNPKHYKGEEKMQALGKSLQEQFASM